MFNLLDDSKEVRNTGLFIFSQLVMGNIILLKDQVADIYVLIEDADPRTSQLAQSLVNELELNRNNSKAIKSELDDEPGKPKGKDYVSNMFKPAFNRLCLNYEHLQRPRLHTIIRRLIAQIKNERSIRNITVELCDRLSRKH